MKGESAREMDREMDMRRQIERGGWTDGDGVRESGIVREKAVPL